MKLSVLALDYDGTLTRDDRLKSIMIDSIAAARRLGNTVMLVTGRRLDDLRRVAGGLRFVDCVVAENGALRRHDAGRGVGRSRASPYSPDGAQPRYCQSWIGFTRSS